MKRYLLVILFVIQYSISDAQIVYHDHVPDTTVYSGSYELKMNSSVSGSVIINFDTQAPGRITVTTSGDYEVMMDTFNRYPARLLKGQKINNSGNWTAMSADTISYGGHIGHWVLVSDDYLPIRFRMSGNWHYGWLKMDIDMIPTRFIVKSWAYNTKAGEGIDGGQIYPTNVKGLESESNIDVHIANRVLYVNGLDQLQSNDILIVDMSGRTIYHKVVKGNSSTNVNLGDRPAGMYIITIQNNFGKYAKRVVL